ncbi:sulfite exporter TauE/SafE family protein [Methanotorris formicicus]|uniref:Probable membrane transporter protein n=1 Tax=Methanotorris formicicus Mc-S-70 TaxID=647171 RepID=H1KZD1_9EURY|nr:sulfite exporter TauE/SafE family protein [Methanotorris formicicus]EHP86157.1 protein of unknown function DUF81 [Methanotorris formicicus Mc-S-70]
MYIFIFLGFLVGFLVGLTGIGGGALMTPSLIFLGVEPLIAVGTDLLYAFITKVFGSFFHNKRNGNVNFNIALKLFLGSLPAIILGTVILEAINREVLNKYVTLILAFVLILSSLISFYKGKSRNRELNKDVFILVGFLVGLVIQLTSVGAGVIVGFILLNFTNLHPKEVVGTTIFYGVFIALLGCLSHLMLGNVDYLLALYLIVGTVPGVYLGTFLNSKVPKEVLRKVIIISILVIGIVMLVKSF